LALCEKDERGAAELAGRLVANPVGWLVQWRRLLFWMALVFVCWCDGVIVKFCMFYGGVIVRMCVMLPSWLSVISEQLAAVAEGTIYISIQLSSQRADSGE
jgi:hypothetical protein